MRKGNKAWPQLAQAIRHFAKAQNMSIAALEREAGMGVGDMHRIMKHDMQVSTLRRVAAALDVDLCHLITRAEALE